MNDRSPSSTEPRPPQPAPATPAQPATVAPVRRHHRDPSRKPGTPVG